MVDNKVSGLQKRGDWYSIVKFGQKVSEVLHDYDVDDELLEEWDYWRPHMNDDFDTDMRRRTSKFASTNPQSVDKERFDNSVRYLLNRCEEFGQQFIQCSEELVYDNLMTRVCPYYFDNQLISANIRKKAEDKYLFEVKINDDSLRSEVEDELV